MPWLRQGVQGISDIITKPGLINVDFADVKTVMQNAGIALEFGTLPMAEVTQALRARHWLAAHPEATARQRADVLKLTRDAFFVDTPAWKAMGVGQARAAALQALAGLAAREGT